MAQSALRPNILFLFTDQQRPNWLGTNPDIPISTPNLDALGERGVRFENAVTPSPLCAPARACLATGMEYDRCGVPENWVPFPVDRREETHFSRLRDEADYHVMGCGKLHLGEHRFGKAKDRSLFDWDRTGRNLLEEWGFSDGTFSARKIQSTRVAEGDPPEPGDPYGAYLAENGLLETHVEDYQRRMNDGIWTATYPTPLPDEAYFDDWITRRGLSLIDDAPRDEPWFLQVNFQNPHHPWDVTETMHDWYRSPDVEFPDPVRCDLDVDRDTHQEIRRNYASMIEHLDMCVGRLINKLIERGELDDTLVVFSSDHGEMLGDYGQWGKHSPLQSSVGVPLIVAGPDVKDRRAFDGPVTTLDLHATFLDVAGLSFDDVDSRSMVPFLSGDTDTHRDVVYSGLSAWRMVFDGRYKLVKGYDPEKRYADESEPQSVDPDRAKRLQHEREIILHDVTRDESGNLAESHPDVVEKLSAELDAIRDRAPRDDRT